MRCSRLPAFGSHRSLRINKERRRWPNQMAGAAVQLPIVATLTAAVSQLVAYCIGYGLAAALTE